MTAEFWKIELLREAGCQCSQPLLGWRPDKGPRCRLCNVEATAKQPSSKEIEDAELWLDTARPIDYDRMEDFEADQRWAMDIYTRAQAFNLGGIKNHDHQP